MIKEILIGVGVIIAILFLLIMYCCIRVSSWAKENEDENN